MFFCSRVRKITIPEVIFHELIKTETLNEREYLLKPFVHKLFMCITVWSVTTGIVSGQKSSAYIDSLLWAKIDFQLKHPQGDQSYDFIAALVIKYSSENKLPQFPMYYKIMAKLESEFNLPAAVYVCEEMAKTARADKNADDEARAYLNLSRFHGALGNEKLTAVSLDKALILYIKAGNKQAILHIKMSKLEQLLEHNKFEKIKPEFDALLDEAKKYNDLPGAAYIHERLVGITLNAKQYKEAEKQIIELEKITISNPIKPNQYGVAITIALGRAELALVNGDSLQAESLYQKGLMLCRAGKSRWLEIRTYNDLAALAWNRGNIPLAKQRLDQAQSLAELLNVYELLSTTFIIKAQIAEQEGKFDKALAFTKKKYYYDKLFQDRSAGFNIQSYNLQLEKDQLAREKKTEDLKLKLSNSQLNASVFISLLSLLLLTGLAIGFIKQRKRKAVLAKQNELIQQQSLLLKNQDAAKSQFFTNISHEIRTPLSLILGPINTLLKENQLTEKQVKLLTSANQNSKQLNRMINEILDLHKLEFGAMTLHTEPTPVYSFFYSHISQFESMAERKEILFSLNIAIEKNIVADIDKEKCRQVIYNLLANAFKYTSPGEQVSVAVNIIKEKLHFSVTDTGVGIHPVDKPFIFDRFFQTNQKNRPAAGGTGIGLALCSEYAQLFNGSVHVESEFGHGSAFHFSCPVANLTVKDILPEPATAPAIIENLPVKPDLQNQPSTAGHKQTILLVEDNPGLQQYLNIILSNHYRVITADNGLAALKLISDTKKAIIPDLIISDLMMPVMDGHQLLEKLKACDNTRHIPVIMLTARADANDKLRALRIGVDDYMTKPFEEEELLVHIETLLKNHAIRKAEAIQVNKKTAALPMVTIDDKEWLENFENHVRKNLADEFLNINALSFEFAMSESTLLRQLKRLTGLTPSQYVQEIRLNEARWLLQNRENLSITQVASKVGYTDARSFSRSFKARFGKPPTDIV